MDVCQNKYIIAPTLCFKVHKSVVTLLFTNVVAICFQQDASSFKSIRLVTSLSFFLAMTIQLALQCYTGNELTIQVQILFRFVIPPCFNIIYNNITFLKTTDTKLFPLLCFIGRFTPIALVSTLYYFYFYCT